MSGRGTPPSLAQPAPARGISPEDLRMVARIAEELRSSGVSQSSGEPLEKRGLGEGRRPESRRHSQTRIETDDAFSGIIGGSEALLKVFQKVKSVAQTDSTVLLLGETGTGKELLARAIYRLSPRRDRPWTKVNCAALPGSLIESELFGYEKGAFTGAHSRRVGRFESVNGGTIFLDEVGDLPPELQAKLLKILQNGEFERLGDSSSRRVDVRVIAATNCNLKRAVEESKFREDLYYRLNVFPIMSPPLRDRMEDIPLLVHHFVRKCSRRFGKRIEGIRNGMMDELMAYYWPGNVRELENLIERAAIMSNGSLLKLCDAHELGSRQEEEAGNARTLKEMELFMIGKALRKSDWVIEGKRGAARRLDIPPSTLRERMQKYGIRRPHH